MTQIEIWKDCIGFEGYYEVSNLGNIRRFGKLKNKIHSFDSDGYFVHIFSCDGIRTNVMVHQLVAEAFNGTRPFNMVTRHKDGIKSNNIPSNLIYGTPKQNSEDMVSHGTQCKGILQHRSKFSEQDILDIRAAYPAQTIGALARLYNVRWTTINLIVKRLTWKHI